VSRRLAPLVLLLLLAGGLPPAARATTRDAALGLAGEVYISHSGACAELLADCPAGGEADPVLALEVVRPGQPTERLLVPETGGPEAEGEPAVVFEDTSQSVFLVWEAHLEPTRSQINLVRYSGGEWSEVIEVTGDIAPLKGPPQVLITRDHYATGAPGETPVEHQRTILHVAWWESGPGAEDVYYAPIIIQDGAYLGYNGVFNLSAWDPNPAAANPVGLSQELQRTPKIEPGRDERSVVIGFASEESERFITFEILVLPGELSDLADRIRSHMIEIGLTGYQVGQVPTFADRIRSHMIEIGTRLHPALLGYLAADVEEEVLAADPASEPLPDLADRIRSHMIEIGARTLGSSGLLGSAPPEVSGVLTTAPPPDASPTAVPHELYLRLVADRTAPAVGDGPVWVFLSEDGRQALVSWENEGDLHYRETDGDGWSAERHIDLTGPVDAARAERILRQRVREQ
jgi:hypothetical protein